MNTAKAARGGTNKGGGEHPAKGGGEHPAGKTSARLAREAVGLTREQLAPAAWITAAHLSRIERRRASGGGTNEVTARRLTARINREADRRGLPHWPMTIFLG